MKARATSKILGGLFTAVLLTLTVPVAHADAAVKSSQDRVSTSRRDTGWDIP